MNARFFLDTNIFVYTFDKSAPAKLRRSTQLVRQGVDTGKGVISYQVVQEFFNLALRGFTHPMSVADAEQYLATVFRPLAIVHSSQALYAEALRSTGRYGFSWYDSLIVSAALESQCAILYSEDLQHGQKIAGLEIQNPFV
jgi:predicted nucleic acid-binding protein